MYYEEDNLKIWNEAFGDSFDDITCFFDSVENLVCLSEKSDDTIVSQLFLIPVKMMSDNIQHNALYLYAAATLKEYRGRGYMSRLLDKAEKYAADNDYDAICLMPGEESLYRYYERYGYQSACFSKRLLLDATDIPILNTDICNGFIHCDSVYEYAEKVYSDCGYKVFCDKCHFIYSRAGNKIIIREWYGENLTDSLHGLLMNENADFVQIDVPFSTDVKKYELIKHGMILPVNMNLSGNEYFLNYILD